MRSTKAKKEKERSQKEVSRAKRKSTRNKFTNIGQSPDLSGLCHLKGI
jgi:hypothetical protein